MAHCLEPMEMGAEPEDTDLVLPPQYTFTPIRALRVTARKKLAQFLDLDGNLMVIILPDSCETEEIDIVNNYNGLAELVQFGYLQIQNMTRCKSPTEELLNLWTSANEGGPTAQATVGNLWKFLTLMERYDVLKDCRRQICYDCRVYEDAMQVEREAENRNFAVQEPTVSNSDMKVNEFKYMDVASVRTGQSVHYNAFICYTFDDAEDLKFVKELIVELEDKKNLRLFVPGRDDLPGSAYHTITAYLIEKKCDRVVLVLSRSFLKSAACDFQLKFAQSLAPGARSKKLIPVLRNRNTPVPRILKFLAMCDFSKTDMRDWVLDRLYSAIIAPIGPETFYEDSEMIDEYCTSDGFDDLQRLTYPKTLYCPFSSSQSSGISSSDSTICGSPDTTLSGTRLELSSGVSSGASMDCTASDGSPYLSARSANLPPPDSSDSYDKWSSDESIHAAAGSSTTSSISSLFPSTDQQLNPSKGFAKVIESQSENLKIRKDGRERKDGKSVKQKSGFTSILFGRKPKKSGNSHKETTRAIHSEVIVRDNAIAGENIRKYNSGIRSDETFQMIEYHAQQKELFDTSICSSSEFVKVDADSMVEVSSMPPRMTEYIPPLNRSQSASVATRKPKPKLPPKPHLEQRRSRSPHVDNASDKDSQYMEKPTIHYV